MANQTRPGGGYLTGAGAQEENLHRRSNLFQHLEDHFNEWPQRPWSFPIADFGAIYSPVRFFFFFSKRKKQNMNCFAQCVVLCVVTIERCCVSWCWRSRLSVPGIGRVLWCCVCCCGFQTIAVQKNCTNILFEQSPLPAIAIITFLYCIFWLFRLKSMSVNMMEARNLQHNFFSFNHFESNVLQHTFFSNNCVIRVCFST